MGLKNEALPKDKDMKVALFINFSNEAFVGMWNSKPEKFAPNGEKGDRKHMEDWKAKHYAKHLVNRELLKKGLENETSPKFPEQHPHFMELFNQAVIIDDEEIELTPEEAASAAISAGYREKSSKTDQSQQDLNPFKDQPSQTVGASASGDEDENATTVSKKSTGKSKKAKAEDGFAGLKE